MDEVTSFGEVALIGAAAVLLAVLSSKLTERVPIPPPAIFLLAAAVASDLFPGLADAISIVDVERLAVVALIVILFEGGMHIGWRRFRASAGPIAALGVVGTFATAGIVAVAAHWLFDFDWTTAGIIGAALAPTDPAVMFSVLGNKEVGGRSGTILEGESGFNDPVGIALMIGMIELATTSGASFSIVVNEFAVEMSIGLAIGLVGGGGLVWLLRAVSLPSAALYPLRALAAAGVIYGLAAVAQGSGFLAVFVAGILLGDAEAPRRFEIDRFLKALASLAEIGVFIGLGITVSLAAVGQDLRWLDGLLLALILAFLARPVAVGPLLLPTRLSLGEKLFVMWGGLKGAVPILLAAFAVTGGVADAESIYGIVFVVVAFSVVVQGLSFSAAANRLGVPMQSTPEPP